MVIRSAYTDVGQIMPSLAKRYNQTGFGNATDALVSAKGNLTVISDCKFLQVNGGYASVISLTTDNDLYIAVLNTTFEEVYSYKGGIVNLQDINDNSTVDIAINSSSFNKTFTRARGKFYKEYKI